MPVPTHSRSTSKSTSTAADETRWQSAQDIRRNLGVGPYALLKLACEGLVLTKNAPPSKRTGRHPMTVYFVHDVLAAYVRGNGRQPPAGVPGVAEDQDARPAGRRARFEELKQTRPPGTALGK